MDILGKVIHDHYFLKPYSHDCICVKGEMVEIHHSLIAKLLIPFGLLFGAIVPYNRKNVPIDVYYNSKIDSPKLYWDRVFKLSSTKDFHFKSHMEYLADNQVIEYVRFGVGMKLLVTAEDGALIFRDNDYVWKLFGINIPIPMNLIFGNAYIEERPIDDEHFSMKMIIKHPVFGLLFRYSGKFSFSL